MKHPSSPSARPRVTVLLSLTPPDGTTKFVDQIVTFAPVEEEIRYFTWARALFGRWDVFHVHWPEFLMRGSSRPVRLARTVLLIAFLTRITVFRLPVVRTVHNLSPHTPGGRLESALLAWLFRRTRIFILLNDATPLDEALTSETILHGHYVDQFAGFTKSASEPGRLLYFGRIEPYKGVDDLMDAFEAGVTGDAHLRIVGKPTPELRELIESRGRANGRISSVLGFVPDAEMVEEITRAALVVLPYREMHNSGVLLVALSLGRPVLAPRSASNELIAREVGGDWLYLFDGPVSAETLERTLTDVASTTRPERPEMATRDWRTVAESHYQVYLAARRTP